MVNSPWASYHGEIPRHAYVAFGTCVLMLATVLVGAYLAANVNMLFFLAGVVLACVEYFYLIEGDTDRWYEDIHRNFSDPNFGKRPEVQAALRDAEERRRKERGRMKGN